MQWLRSGVPIARPAVVGLLGVDTPTACALTGVSTRQINHWDRADLVRPSILSAQGSGTRRRYGLEDLMLLDVARQLRLFNLKLDHIAAVLAKVRNVVVDFSAPDTFVLMGKDRSVRVNNEPVAAIGDACRSGTAIVVNVSTICRQLIHACSRYSAAAECSREKPASAPASYERSQEDLSSRPPQLPPADLSRTANESSSVSPGDNTRRRIQRQRVQSDSNGRTDRRGVAKKRIPAASTWGESW